MPQKSSVAKTCFVVSIVLGSAACDSKRDTPVPPGETGLVRVAVAAETPKTGSSKEAKPAVPGAATAELGAASWIPEDAAYFSSSLRVREQWQAMTESRAFKKVLVLPAVQMALGQVRQHAFYKQLLERSAKDPLLQSLLEVAQDAVSSEIFIYAGPSLTSFLVALSDLYSVILVKGLIASDDDSHPRPDVPPISMLRPVVAKLLEHEKDFRVPSAVIGFRLANPEAARIWLAKALDRLKDVWPAPIGLEEAGGGKYHTLRLSYKDLPSEARRAISGETARSGLSGEEVEKLSAFLSSRTLTLAAGLRGSYLLLSIGEGIGHLETLGQGPSLASSAAFAPIRGALKPNLVSLSYLDAKLAGVSAGVGTTDEWMVSLNDLLESPMASGLPQNAVARLKKDARTFLDEVTGTGGAPGSSASMTFLDRGLETFSFSARNASRLDSSRPLSILARAGASPLIAIAARGMPARETYARFAHWTKVAYGYFVELVLPRVPKAELADVERFQRLFIPAVEELHQTTATLLLPAIDGCEDLLAVDGAGVLLAMPGERVPLLRPFRYARPLLAIQVNDMEKLTNAFSQYRLSLNRFFQRAESELNIAPIQINAPDSSPHAGGTRYAYPIPPLLGAGFAPHALLKEKLAIFALGPDQSQSAAEAPAKVPEGPIDLSAAAGMVYRVDVAAIGKLLLDDIGAIVIEQGKQRALSPQLVPMVLLHLPEIEKALTAIKSFSGRVYADGAHEVHHSWIRVEDISDD